MPSFGFVICEIAFEFKRFSLTACQVLIARMFNIYNAAGVSRQKYQNLTNLVKKCQQSRISLPYLESL